MKRSPPPERRTPLARGSKELKRTPLARESSKRRAEYRARRAVVDEATARDGARCIARELVPEVECAGPLDPDEYDLRSARPGGHLDVDNVQMICRAHHDWKGREPIEAARRGLRPFPVGYMGDDAPPVADRSMPDRRSPGEAL